MKSIVFDKDNRSGNKLHIELPGCTINIDIGLTDRLGRAVTSIRISPDDESRGGDGHGYCWRQVDATRIIRDLLPGMHGQPSATAEDCRFCMARIEQGDDHEWRDVTDAWNGEEPDPNRDEDSRLACPQAPRRDSGLYPGLHEPVPPPVPFEAGELVTYLPHPESSQDRAPAVFVRYSGPSQDRAGVLPAGSALRGATGHHVLAWSSALERIPAELISAARSWAADCDWAEEAEDIADMTDLQVVAGVQAHYEGGWAAFAAAGTA